jgi:hypothetical protein
MRMVNVARSRLSFKASKERLNNDTLTFTLS